MQLKGIFPAIPTPFYADGSLYLKKLEHNVERYTRAPISGLVVLGSTGEAVFLNCEEQRQILSTAISAAADSKVMIAGCGHESVRETLEFCDYAATLGYDAVMVRTPSYYRAQMSAPAMLNYFRMVADRSPLPVLLYSFPQATGYDLPVELIAELAEHRNIVGIKESSGDVAKVERIVQRTAHIRRQARSTHDFQPLTGRMIARAVAESQRLAPSGAALAEPASMTPSAMELIGGLRARQSDVGFQVLVGSAHRLEALLNVGAVGGILAFAACAPTACFELFAAFQNRDQRLMAEKQQQIASACQRVANELGVAGVKYATDLNGYYGGAPRLPLLPLTALQRQEVERLMAEIKA